MEFLHDQNYSFEGFDFVDSKGQGGDRAGNKLASANTFGRVFPRNTSTFSTFMD